MSTLVVYVQFPEYWKNQKITDLNESLSSASEDGILDERTDNSISDIDIAFEVLIDAGIISSPDYWRKLVEENNVLYLKDLLVNMANRCRIVLEKIVYAESQDEDEKGQILVANVIANRSNNKNFSTGIYIVVFQENQFQSTHNGAYGNTISKCKKRRKQGHTHKVGRKQLSKHNSKR